MYTWGNSTTIKEIRSFFFIAKNFITGSITSYYRIQVRVHSTLSNQHKKADKNWNWCFLLHVVLWTFSWNTVMTSSKGIFYSSNWEFPHHLDPSPHWESWVGKMGWMSGRGLAGVGAMNHDDKNKMWHVGTQCQFLHHVIATPYEFHTPPVEDLRNILHRGSVNSR